MVALDEVIENRPPSLCCFATHVLHGQGRRAQSLYCALSEASFRRWGRPARGRNGAIKRLRPAALACRLGSFASILRCPLSRPLCTAAEIATSNRDLCACWNSSIVFQCGSFGT